MRIAQSKQKTIQSGQIWLGYDLSSMNYSDMLDCLLKVLPDAVLVKRKLEKDKGK